MTASQANNEINKVIKKIGDKVTKEKQREIEKKVSEVVSFSEQQMKISLSESMRKEFQNFYGAAFSPDILKQLYSISIVNLRPEISYYKENSNMFKANLDTESLLDDLDEFIADIDESENEEEYYDEEFYNEYYGDIDNVEEELDYTSSKKKVNWEASFYNKKWRKGEIPHVEDAFRIAKENSLKKFNLEELPKLRTYSKKKIGIDIF